MSALTSLLVRDQKVPVRKIEEAIQRQVIAGGGLDTVLLELGVIRENEMAAYCAAVHLLGAASRSECMAVPRDVIRLVPGEVAERHRLIPLAVQDRALVVAVASPLSLEVDQQLGFLLGMGIVQRVATEVRISAALSNHYGVEPSPRLRRLATKLDISDPGETTHVIPSESASRPSTRPSARPLSVPPARSPSNQPLEIHTGASTKRFGTVPEGRTDSVRVVGVSRVGGQQGESSTAPYAIPPEGTESRSPSAPPASLRGPAPAPRRPSVAAGPLTRHRGPLTARDATELLKQADEREDILEIAFGFLRQFFDLTGLFLVQDGRAEGLDLAGKQSNFDRFVSLSVDLKEPSSLSLVFEGAVPVMSHLDASPVDRRVREFVGGRDSMPAILIPIAIRQRVVLVFYGDRSGEPFGLSEVPEAVAFAPRVSEAFLQLIVKRKLRQSSAGAVTAPEPDPPASEPAPARDSRERRRTSESVRSRRRTDPPPSMESSPPPNTTPDVSPPGSILPPSQPPPKPVLELDSPLSPPRRMRPRKRSVAFEVLGVPREAPPPPEPGARPAVTASERSVSDAAPAPAEDDDEPELIYELPVSDPPPAEVGRPEPRAGVYAISGGSTEVIGPVGKQRNSARPASRTDSSPPPEPGIRDTIPEMPAFDGATEERPVDDHPRVDEPTRQSHSRPDRSTTTTDSADTPSVIVEMGDAIESAVEELRYSGPDAADPAVHQVVQQGEAALPVLVREFPGPLWFDRTHPHRRLPRGRDVSAIARTMVAFHELAVPYVASLLDRDDADSRFYAVLVASEFSHPRLVAPLGRRVFDGDGGVAALAIDVLRGLAPFERELSQVIESVRSEARVPRHPFPHRARAVRALGELRDAGCLELLQKLMQHEPELAKPAHQALVTITRQDFGSSASKWSEWIDDHGQQHRIEWLIDALLHSEEQLRRVAGEELKHLTQEYYGYHPALPRRDREIAQRKYRAWWTTEGRRRFQVIKK